MEKIKKLLLQNSNVIYNIKLSVLNYKEVILAWKNYKSKNELNILDEHDKHIIKNIFNFHKLSIDHIILYYSKELIDCLIMCKINNKYINLQIPTNDLISNLNRSFIAVYAQ